MPKLPGVPHLAAIRGRAQAGFRIVRQGKHVVMSGPRRPPRNPNLHESGSYLSMRDRTLAAC